MKQLNIGDKVKVVKCCTYDCGHECIGRNGVIDEIDIKASYKKYNVNIIGMALHWVISVELVKPKKKKVEKKCICPPIISDHLWARSISICPVHNPRPVGRPKKVIGAEGRCLHGNIKGKEDRCPCVEQVTFKVTKLEDGTELIFIPNKDWDYHSGLNNTYFIFRKVKK